VAAARGAVTAVFKPAGGRFFAVGKKGGSLETNTNNNNQNNKTHHNISWFKDLLSKFEIATIRIAEEGAAEAQPFVDVHGCLFLRRRR
jgi:hypothetical protein